MKRPENVRCENCCYCEDESGVDYVPIICFRFPKIEFKQRDEVCGEFREDWPNTTKREPTKAKCRLCGVVTIGFRSWNVPIGDPDFDDQSQVFVSNRPVFLCDHCYEKKEREFQGEADG